MLNASPTHTPVQAVLDVGKVLGWDDDARLREAVLLPQLRLTPSVEVSSRRLGIRRGSVQSGGRGAGALRCLLCCNRDAFLGVPSRICLPVLPDCINGARDLRAAVDLPVHPPLEWDTKAVQEGNDAG